MPPGEPTAPTGALAPWGIDPMACQANLVVRQGFFEQLTALDWAHRYCQNFG